MTYEMREIVPCADYDGFTVEGTFSQILELNTTLGVLNKIMDNVKFFDIANILSANYDGCHMYIYDNKEFIISKIKTLTEAKNIVNMILSEYVKQKEC